MAAGNVEINSNGYVLIPFKHQGRTFIVRHYVFKQTVNIEGGLENPDARAGVWPVKFYPPYYGMGRRRILKGRDGRVDPRDHFRYWDAEDVKTTHASQVSLSILRTADTGELSVIGGSAFFKGSLWTLWYAGTGVSAHSIESRELTSSVDTAWGGGGVVDNVAGGDPVAAFDLHAHKTSLIALWMSGADTHETTFSTDGITWTQATTDITTELIGSGHDGEEEGFDGGLFATVGNELVAAVWHEKNGSITFFSSTDSSASWTDEAVDIASSSGVKGVATYQGADNADKLLVCTENGLYEVDTAPSTWTIQHIFPMSSHTDNGRRMTVHNGSVWIPIGVDSDAPAGMVKYTMKGGERIFEVNETSGVLGDDAGIFLGFAAGDGVPSNKLGPVHWLKSINGILYAAAGGTAANRNGHIFKHNGFGWQFVANNSTANQKAYWVDDAAGTIHYANRTSTATNSSTSDSVGLPNEGVNPNSGIALTYELNGYLELPEDNLDSADVPKNMLDINVDAEDLTSTSGEYINLDYGINGAAASGTSPTDNSGNVVSAQTTINLGTNNEGVSAFSIQMKENYIRDAGSTADSPKRRIMTIRMDPRFATLNGFQMEVDVDATASIRGRHTTREAIITELETIRDSVVMVNFRYSPIAQTYLSMVRESYSSFEDLPTKITTDTTTTQRRVIVGFNLEER